MREFTQGDLSPWRVTSQLRRNRPSLVQIDVGSNDRLALQNLQIPEGSTNRTIP